MAKAAPALAVPPRARLRHPRRSLPRGPRPRRETCLQRGARRARVGFDAAWAPRRWDGSPSRSGARCATRAWRESVMRVATCIGATAVAAVLALTGTREALAGTRDAWITTRAKMALLATEGLRGGTINVDTVNGRVTLHGRVRTADEKTKAEDAVRTVDGVKDVRNILQVVGGYRE